jgi:hypothetical protein
MDALNMAAISASGAPRGSDRPAASPGAEDYLALRMRAALGVLLQAYDYARDLDTSTWDFATEIASLRRLKLSNSDLRWLVGRGYVEHGIEVTLAGSVERSFQHPARLLFNKKTCFVLSPPGAALAQELARNGDALGPGETRAPAEPPMLAIAEPPLPHPPKWDRNRRELTIGSTLVKRFKIPSAAEETILAAFQELRWPARIDDPLPASDEPSTKWRLQKAIEALNQNQKQPLIRFVGDGTGRGVLWEFRAEGGASRDH